LYAKTGSRQRNVGKWLKRISHNGRPCVNWRGLAMPLSRYSSVVRPSGQRWTRFYDTPLNQIHKALDGLERAGVLVSRVVGTTREYEFNARYALRDELRALLTKALSLYPARLRDESEFPHLPLRVLHSRPWKGHPRSSNMALRAIGVALRQNFPHYYNILRFQHGSTFCIRESRIHPYEHDVGMAGSCGNEPAGESAADVASGPRLPVSSCCIFCNSCLTEPRQVRE
jgi:hypothetical protein